MRESITTCGDLGEASWAPRVSRGLVGAGVGQEVSDSHQKAELKPLWSRALPAAAPTALLGKLRCCEHYCEITDHKRILNCIFCFVHVFSSSFYRWLLCGSKQGAAVCQTFNFFGFMLSYPLSCRASAYSHSFLLRSCRLENQLLHSKRMFAFDSYIG